MRQISRQREAIQAGAFASSRSTAPPIPGGILMFTNRSAFMQGVIAAGGPAALGEFGLAGPARALSTVEKGLML